MEEFSTGTYGEVSGINARRDLYPQICLMFGFE